jgi:branched-chain amino acid transport system ATP-binding protein
VGDGLILETRKLSKQFKGFIAVRDVDLKVRAGSIHALIGPNGAGKTTVFNLLTKFLTPSSGRIFYRGEDVTALAAARIARQGVVRSFQISAVFPHLTALENVRVALQRKRGGNYDFWRAERVLARFDARATELLDWVGLAEHRHLPAGELAYGRKRALEIATTLALEPDMMLLDEPMAGLGREDIARIAALIKRVAEGRTVLMVEHNLSVVADLSHRITVLQRGEILAEGSYEEVSRNKDVIAAYMGAGHG